MPYLRECIPAPDDDDYDAKDAMMAVGVVGDDGRRIRFCEYDDDDPADGERGMVDGTPSSAIRVRLGRGHVVGMADDDDLDDVDPPGMGSDDDDDDDDDTDGDSGAGSAGDEEILRELGLSDFFANGDGNGGGTGFDASTDDDDVDDDYDDDDVDRPHRPGGGPRSFRVLWELLARWATPSTVGLVLDYRSGCERPPMRAAVDRRGEDDDDDDAGGGIGPATVSYLAAARNDVDIGASRRAGIMSMAKMHVPRSMSELKVAARGAGPNSRDGNDNVDRKNVEQRLADLVGTFDPSVPAANLSTKMWKGLTTILIAIAFPVEEARMNRRRTTVLRSRHLFCLWI